MFFYLNMKVRKLAIKFPSVLCTPHNLRKHLMSRAHLLTPHWGQGRPSHVKHMGVTKLLKNVQQTILVGGRISNNGGLVHTESKKLKTKYLK